ncbi:hypothetical protein TNCV_1101961 [Trichonephila clavipes]|nr:hypothetical protein TNCV_1101961 [Trichonephila clavipes]
MGSCLFGLNQCHPSGIVISNTACGAARPDWSSGEGMGICNCIVPLRHGGTLNSRQTASLLVSLMEGKREHGSLPLGRKLVAKIALWQLVSIYMVPHLKEIPARRECTSSPPGGATAYQLLHRSIICQVANRVAENYVNLALSPPFHQVSIK